MARSKTAPKRRRVEEEEAEKQALQTLLAAPADQVEAAAAEATRASMAHWPTVDPQNLPEWLTGLGVATTLPPEHLEALRALHERIKDQAHGTWASWSGSPNDPRRRAFGVLPHTLGCRDTVQERLDISTPWRGSSSSSGSNNQQQLPAVEESNDERSRNHQAIVQLHELPEGTCDAIDWLCQTLRPAIPQSSSSSSSKEGVQDYLHYDHLIAAQPNLHCGRDLLPIHVDHPLKDGFGVIIVTISMVGSGTILLQNFTETQKRTMPVAQGQAYMLSGRARDACAHGVVATKSEDGKRESLNLRFGLHDYDDDDASLPPRDTDDQSDRRRRRRRLPLIPSSDVLQYWELTTTPTSTKTTSSKDPEKSGDSDHGKSPASPGTEHTKRPKN